MPIFAALYHDKPEPSAEHLPGHIAFLTDLRAKRVVIGNGRLLAGPGGLVLLEAESLGAAGDLLAPDPFLVHGLRRLELFEWDVRWAEGRP